MAEILFQLGFFSGLGIAMKPLLIEEKGEENWNEGSFPILI
jgi:hypothetical protein